MGSIVDATTGECGADAAAVVVDAEAADSDDELQAATTMKRPWLRQRAFSWWSAPSSSVRSWRSAPGSDHPSDRDPVPIGCNTRPRADRRPLRPSERLGPDDGMVRLGP